MRLPQMPGLRPFRLFTIKLRNTRPARCVTRPSTARTRAACSLNHKGKLSMRGTSRLTTSLRYDLSLCSLSLMILSVPFSLCVPCAVAQEESAQTGVEQGNYNIKQAIEFGGRFLDQTGDQQAYNTFVN